MRPSERLRRAAARLWSANLRHPFVVAIGAGTLPRESFTCFLRQDYLFLVDYCRVLAAASAKAVRLDDMTRFAELLRATLTTEMSLHRRVCAREGITRADLERTRPTATTRAYTGFLLRVAREGDFAALVAALLPCLWGYAQVGVTLQRRGLPGVRRYDDWIRSYAHPDFVALARWLRHVYDRVGDARAAHRALFARALEHEIAFWEAAWLTTQREGRGAIPGR